MRTRPSLTAEGVCLLRAASGDDPYAEALLGPVGRAGLAAWRAARRLRLPVDAVTLGMEAAVRARHRFFDEALVAALDRGAAQVVLLGAGYDSRPWRFAERLAGRAVFEVDHPATLAARSARAARLPPSGARRVPVDFAAADFGAALLDAGFDPARPSFFVWEGVSMYLRREAVAATLERVAGLLAPDSEIGFDVWVPLTGRAASVERLGLALVKRAGEPIVFALPPDELAPFLAARGLRLVEQSRVDHVAARYGYGAAYRGLFVVRAVR
jgi:methyltransferase (TIGR00027 family)